MIDLGPAFALGLINGFIQHIVAPRAELNGNLFEIITLVLTAFLARALGSIGSRPFCFPALFQAAVGTMLPGFLVFSASIELLSRSIVAGAVRLVYAIIYTLIIGKYPDNECYLTALLTSSL